MAIVASVASSVAAIIAILGYLASRKQIQMAAEQIASSGKQTAAALEQLETARHTKQADTPHTWLINGPSQGDREGFQAVLEEASATASIAIPIFHRVLYRPWTYPAGVVAD